MDKQKQIEEMMKDIAVRMAMAKGVAGSMNKGVEGWLAEYLVNKGWQQITEGAVVLTREEYDALKTIEKYHIKSCGSNSVVLTEEEWANCITIDEFIEKVKKTVKETAKEIWITGKYYFEKHTHKDVAFNRFADWIKEHYGVEVE